MKYRYLIANLIDGDVVGTNAQPMQEDLENEELTYIDLACNQIYDPYKKAWETIKEVK